MTDDDVVGTILFIILEGVVPQLYANLSELLGCLVEGRPEVSDPSGLFCLESPNCVDHVSESFGANPTTMRFVDDNGADGGKLRHLILPFCGYS